MFTVYGKESCKFCKKAIELLEENEEFYEYVDITLEGNESYRNMLKNMAATTVPQIFENHPDNPDADIYIGGFDDLSIYLTLNQ